VQASFLRRTIDERAQPTTRAYMAGSLIFGA
jgi:hypothetical protein